jgi:hypothetical protein
MTLFITDYQIKVYVDIKNIYYNNITKINKVELLYSNGLLHLQLHNH